MTDKQAAYIISLVNRRYGTRYTYASQAIKHVIGKNPVSFSSRDASILIDELKAA